MSDPVHSDESVRAIGASLAANPEIVSPRERELLEAIIDRLRAEGFEATGLDAVHRAIGSAVGARVAGLIRPAETAPDAEADEATTPPSIFATASTIGEADGEDHTATGQSVALARHDAIDARVWAATRAVAAHRLAATLDSDAGECEGHCGIRYRWRYDVQTRTLDIGYASKPLLLPHRAVEAELDAVLLEARTQVESAAVAALGT